MEVVTDRAKAGKETKLSQTPVQVGWLDIFLASN
jgi:hypothetical protein